MTLSPWNFLPYESASRNSGGLPVKGSSIVTVMSQVAAMAQVQYVAQELLHSTGMAKKKKKTFMFQTPWATQYHFNQIGYVNGMFYDECLFCCEG